eukprot:CAMPEP_0201510628 /NCGR_PEP_ID=MMETSP0161_2-20130828/3231_1 /ASSEMBLY_ACC=CAM_ASM_000251 /TAXON_ID=180227 /ORGANISM="Neoparamoeba aestuarina, Strain SoJaBio B1-5/56/2" /LENGTH=493 /DNA_ID=CAMNT_0047905821 /DNA_START=59 /DNA_END=1540 /DNA_ORIENTATION=-
MSKKENFPVAGHGDFTVENPPVSEWVGQNQLSDPKFGDVAFSFDKKQVYAHSHILCVRCRVLYEMYDKIASKHKKKRKQLVVLTIPQPYGNDYPITVEVFELVLQFLYADNIQLETLGAQDALNLCNAAKAFDLPRLARICRDRVHEVISLENVHHLLKAAHDTKEDKSEKYCIQFAATKRKEFIGNKEAVEKIGVDLFQEVMVSLMAMDEEEGAKESTPVPASTLVDDFKKLYTDTDVGAVHGDSSISFKGNEVSFHKAFFAARSKSLSQSFQPSLDGNEDTTAILKVKDILTTVDAFRAILKYLYYGDLSGLTVLIACEVTQFAKTHQMPELQYICEFIMAVNINVDSVMSIMRVVFNPGNIKRPDLEDIRKNSLTFFRLHIAELNLDMMSLLQNGPLVMAEIILAWQEARKEGGDEKPKAVAAKKHEAASEEEKSSGLAHSESAQSLGEDGSSKGEEGPGKKEKRKKKSSGSRRATNSKRNSKGKEEKEE